MGEIRVPVLVKAQRGAVQGHGLECQVGLGAAAAVGGRQGHGLQGVGGGHDRQRRQQVAGAPDHQQRGPGAAGFLGGRGWALLVLLRAVRALMLLDVAAEDEGVSGLEQALFAAEGLARGVLQLLVQVEIVLAFAAVAALVTVEGPLPGVHAHVLDELVGGLGQVAALVALVVVAQAMRSGVRLQLQLVGLHRLADPALVLHLVVGLHVALHGGGAVGGITAEWAPAGGGGEARTGEGQPRGVQGSALPGCSPPRQPALGHPPSSKTRPGPCPTRPCRLLGTLGGSAADRAIPWPARGQESPGCTGGCQPPGRGTEPAPGWGGVQLSCSPLQSPPPGPSEPSPPPTGHGRGLTLKTSPLDGSNTKNRLFMHHTKHTQKG